MKTELENMEILRLSNEESNRVTRECLRIAMFKLLGKQSFEKITITELTKNAGVSRLAFYRNYGSKDELVADVCSKVFDELKNSLNSDCFFKNRKLWFTNFFRTIQENSEYFRIYLEANLKLCDGIILETVFPTKSVEEHYAAAAREGAFLRILTEWFRDGMKESPEEMSIICDRLFPAMITGK